MIVRFSELPKLRQSLKDKKIVLGGGVFDLLHPGHVKFIQSLKPFGDIVVIAVSSNKRVVQKKGDGRPILSEKDRALLVDSIRYVDYVFIVPEPASNRPNPKLEAIVALRPDVFISSDKRYFLYREELESHNIKLKIVPPKLERISTTKLITKIVDSHGK